MQLGRSDWGFCLLAETPQLKPLGIDCFFDRIAGEIMGRRVVQPDGARGGPGTKVLWKPAAREVARKRVQTLPRFRLENVNPHGLTLLRLTMENVAGGAALEVRAYQIV